MTWQVQSSRLSWPSGTILAAEDLAGCNIEALVQGGHLVLVEQERTPSEYVPVSPRGKRKVEPVDPVTDNDSADEPEEQE
jgi:hypothetical protein